eukprot:4363824-Amphidinium_carterae.1
MDQSVQSVSVSVLITLGLIPLSAAISVALSQKVKSEISQKIKSVIRFVIRVTTMRNQRKVRLSQKKKSARISQKCPKIEKTKNGKRPFLKQIPLR